ncbi:MAG: tRNA (adenosine(37)-N6)-threonylcarbamoyltransferase complex dimerization subunit type 1 TsaB [Burkholderiales bacterium]|jgi:tRNA threonylcarbamoyladenosine biosynthesis protein TsaB|nr:tRNA (adenosine(37)-N6)-threonylcarbamoyltransferase complex dimerization subunit type 1 TsaB [Burkholderiales bacterium]
MKILALDTSTEWLSVAVNDGSATDWHTRDVHATAGHSGQILPLIQDVLSEAQTALRQLDVIALGIGPGSFTGVRIACSVAQGLALGAGIPLVAVSGLQAMARTASEKHGWARILTLLDARMNEIYATAWCVENGVWQEDGETGVYRPEQWRRLWQERIGSETWHGAGDGLSVFPELKELFPSGGTDEDIRPTARVIGALARGAFERGEILRPEQTLPHYVRQRVALTIQQRAAGEKW